MEYGFVPCIPADKTLNVSFFFDSLNAAQDLKWFESC